MCIRDRVVKASKTTQAIDDEEETLTVTIVAMDELLSLIHI